jgi:hypothetical protein
METTMTRQEIFNKVADHLLTQGKPALFDEIGDCAYRGQDGSMCAVGCLIPDELYTPEMELKSVDTLLNAEFVLPGFFYDNYTLLSDLQRIHDSVAAIPRPDPASVVDKWCSSLAWYAENHDLEKSPKMLERFASYLEQQDRELGS